MIRKTKLKHFLQRSQGFKPDSLNFRLKWSLFFFPNITNVFLLAFFESTFNFKVEIILNELPRPHNMS